MTLVNTTKKIKFQALHLCVLFIFDERMILSDKKITQDHY